MLLTSDIAVDLVRGQYVFVATMASGTSAMKFSIDNGTTYTDVPDGTASATTGAVVALPNCKFKATLTGDATFSIERLSFGG